MAKVRLIEVAKRAGTSTATVSRVLNRRLLNHTSPATRRRVREAALALGYSVNPIARAMKTNRTMTLGVSVLGLGSGHGIYAEEIEWQAQLQGFDLFIAVEREQPLRELKRLWKRQVDGLVFIRNAKINDPEQILDQLQAESFPLVCIGPQPAIDIPTTDWNRQAGVRELCQAMIDYGARRLLSISHWLTPGTQERQKGFFEAINGCRDSTSQILLLSENRRIKAGRDQVIPAIREKLREFKPEAVIVQGEEILLLFNLAIRDLGWTVPRDLLLASASPLIYGEFHEPPVTSLEPDCRTVAKTAITMLKAMIAGHPLSSHQLNQLVKPRIAWRASTGRIQP